jgi:hypothetical protein
VDVKTSLLLEELRQLMPALRQLPELAKALGFLVRSLEERVGLIETRCGRSWLPLVEITNNLQRLEHAVAMATAATPTGQPAPPPSRPELEELPQVTRAELVRRAALIPELLERIEALEARGLRGQTMLSIRAEGFESNSSPRTSHQTEGGPLRAEIASILKHDPGPTGRPSWRLWKPRSQGGSPRAPALSDGMRRRFGPAMATVTSCRTRKRHRSHSAGQPVRQRQRRSVEQSLNRYTDRFSGKER